MLKKDLNKIRPISTFPNLLTAGIGRAPERPMSFMYAIVGHESEIPLMFSFPPATTIALEPMLHPEVPHTIEFGAVGVNVTAAVPVIMILTLGDPVTASVEVMESSPSTITDVVLMVTIASLGKMSFPMILIPPVNVRVELLVISMVTHLPQGMVRRPLDVYEAPTAEYESHGDCMGSLQLSCANVEFDKACKLRWRSRS